MQVDLSEEEEEQVRRLEQMRVLERAGADLRNLLSSNSLAQERLTRVLANAMENPESMDEAMERAGNILRAADGINTAPGSVFARLWSGEDFGQQQSSAEEQEPSSTGPCHG